MSVFDCWPVTPGVGGAYISQEFGAKNAWEAHPHAGIDVAADEGTPIVAPCDGFIVWASFDTFPPGNTWEMIPYNPGSGGCTILQPSDPNATALQVSFSHQSRIIVSPGQFVRAGQVIGYVGSSGNSSGPHVHFEAFIDYAEGVYPAGTFYGRVNPLEYFKTAGVVPVINTGGKGSVPVINEEDELNADQNNALADTWKTTKRNNQILEALDVNVNNRQSGAIAGLTAAINALAKEKGAADIDKAIRDAVESTAPTYYVKAEKDATVYALDVATGELRPVTLAEWNLVNAAGITLRVVPQKFIDAAPKGAAE